METLIDNEKYTVIMNDKKDRSIEAKEGSFNFRFRYSDGVTMKWGKTIEEDPTHNPFGPEIADIEITKACRGIRNKEDGLRHVCKFCYKQNSPEGSYMSLDTFKHLFNLIDTPKTLTQIAFGVDAEASEELNPDIWKIFEYTREHDVVPNVTVADITEDTAAKIVHYCGACAVSVYQSNPDCCYNSVELLLKEAKAQGKQFAVNIHCLLSEETAKFCNTVVDHYQYDARLKGMGAIVFLSLKQKGRGTVFQRMPDDSYNKLIWRCLTEGVRFGMDSCGANKFLKAVERTKWEGKFDSMIEPCESTLFSSYFNVDAKFFPCSFMEGVKGWEDGIDTKDMKDFVKELWYNPRVVEYRNAAIERITKNGGCNFCPYYNV